MKAILCRTLLLAALVGLLGFRPAAAQEPGLIRDQEIENTIRAYATPLFKAAGLDAGFVQIYLVNSPQINAFVAGGQRLFINTGLLMRSQRANQVIGVIAHETGHIAGGHLVRSQQAFENATAQSIIGVLLGAAGAVLTKNGDVVAAGALAGQSMGQRSLFAYSISQEERADQAGLNFLDKTGQSSRGLLEFFEILEREEALLPQQQDPYLRTHPFTSSRADFVRNHVAHSPLADVPDSPEFAEMHRRMVAKLRGFLNAPGQVVQQYPETDHSTAARYARAIAYHRVPMDERAQGEMDSLLKDEPNNPYFHELKGQILFEGGHVAESVAPYKRASELLPNSALLKVEYAQAAMEADEGPAVAKSVEPLLKDAIRLDDSNADAWHELAISLGRSGQIGQAALALAEEALLAGALRDAQNQAIRATQLLPRGSPGWIRADDIRREVRVEKQDAER